MSDVFRQRDWTLTTRHFTKTDKGLIIKEGSLLKSNEYLVPFEKIGCKRTTKTFFKKGWFIATVVFFLLAAVLYMSEKAGGKTGKNADLVYLFLGAISALVTAAGYKKFIYLTTEDNTNAIDFLYNNPSKEQLDNYLKQLIDARNIYLKKKYVHFNKTLGYDQQYNDLRWLADMEVLTEPQFEKALADLNNLFNQTTEIKGFKFGDPR